MDYFGPTKSDKNNQMIQLTDFCVYIIYIVYSI